MIDKKGVQHIAKLARIGVTQTEEKKFQKDLSSILDYFNSLQELDVSSVNPTFHPTEEILKKSDPMREDQEKPQTKELAEKLIELAPQRSKRHIKVKAVF